MTNHYSNTAVHSKTVKVTLIDLKDGSIMLIHESVLNAVDTQRLMESMNTLSYFLPPHMKFQLEMERFDE